MLHNGLIRQGVDLDADVGRLSPPGIVDFPVNFFGDGALQAVGGRQQDLGLRHRLAHGQGLEYRRGALADLRVRRHQGQIRIQPGGFLVVISGADLGDILGLAVHNPGNQAQLGVDLIPRQAVDHIASRRFQLPGPLDVVGLVKAGLQLHQHLHILAVFRRLHQGADHLAVPGHPVQGNFDGYHRIVGSRLPENLQKRVHPLEGIGQQLILLEHLRQEGLPADKLSGLLGGETGIEIVRVLAQLILNLRKKGQIQRGPAFQHPLFVQANGFAQLLQGFLAQGAAQFQPHRLQLLAFLHQLRHELPVVQILVIHRVRIDVGAAGHPNQGLGVNLITLEGQGQKVKNQFFREDVLPRGNGHQPGKHPGGAGDNSQPPLAVLPVQHRHGIDLLVSQEGKGLPLAHHHRGQQGQQLPDKIPFQPLAVRLGDGVKVHNPDPGPGQLLHQGAVQGIPAQGQLLHRLQHRLNLLPGKQAGFGVPGLLPHGNLILQRADADHKEFVQVALINGGEGQPLTQRHRLPLRFLQHPLVELQPGQLSVYITFFPGFSVHFRLLFLGGQGLQIPGIFSPVSWMQQRTEPSHAHASCSFSHRYR